MMDREISAETEKENGLRDKSIVESKYPPDCNGDKKQFPQIFDDVIKYR
jgi:hypothetical protein